LHLTGFHCASEALTPACQEEKPLLQIKLPIDTWQDHFSWQNRGGTPVTREVETTIYEISDEYPEI
jgi:hypothetical protein